MMRDDDLTRKTAHFTSSQHSYSRLYSRTIRARRSAKPGGRSPGIRGDGALIRSTATATATVHGDCRALAKLSRPLIDRRAMNFDLPFLLALYLSSSLFRDPTSPALRQSVASLSLSVSAFRNFLFPRSRATFPRPKVERSPGSGSTTTKSTTSGIAHAS